MFIWYKITSRIKFWNEDSPRFFGLVKIHKPLLPLRPIVSGIGSISEGCAKHLSKLLNAVKGKNGHAVKNSQDFVNKISELEVPPGKKMVSFDVTALFTSIPVDFALQAAKRKLSADSSWRRLTELNLDQVLSLLEFCLSTTYFVFQGTFYKQQFGAPMGSPISPGIADLSMEVFEEEMLAYCPRHLAPDLWLRYVDDTFTVLHEYSIEPFSAFLNGRNPHIQFTKEVEENDKLAFLDTCIHLQDDGTTKTTVYRKPTHTDQYLNWDSNHPLDHKRSVVRTLLNRVDTHISDPQDRKQEVQHVKTVLKANGYKDWAMLVPNQQDASKRQQKKADTTPKTSPPLIGLPYIRGLSEELQRVFSEHGVNIYHKPSNTLRSHLVRPKDKQEKKDKCGIVYQVPCGSCDDFYVGETARSLGKRFEEHAATDRESAVLEHVKKSGHSVSFEDVRVLASEPRFHQRKVREALEIFKRRPSLNRDQGYEVAPVLLNLLPSPQVPPPHQQRAGHRAGLRSRPRTSSL